MAPSGRGLGGLAAGVGIDLGVEHQHVDVAPRGQHVVEPAVADVIGPAVAADEPDRAAHEVVDDREQVFGLRVVLQGKQAGLQEGDAFALRADLGFVDLRGGEDFGDEVFAQFRGKLFRQRLGHAEMLVGGEAEAEAEFGIVLEERVRPGGAAALGVLRPGGDRQVAAVDRRAAGGVGHHQPVAEELREELDVGRLAAAGTGAGEFEQRFEELHAADVGEVDPGAVVDRQGFEEGRGFAGGLDQRGLVGEVDRLDARLGQAERGAGLDAEAAAGAILEVELQRELRVGVATGVDRGGKFRCRGPARSRVRRPA